jgi:pimeloyl-ACP methyl ester carboxylesterase
MNHEIPLARRRWVQATAAAGLAVGLLAGCSSSAQSTAPAASTPSGTLSWKACNDPVAQDPELQCATLTVPLDYDTPAGATIDLALIRLPATGTRVGAVLTNPGGPGGSGFDMIANGANGTRAALGLDRFDLIGFDPRGVDRSGGLRCLTDAQLDAANGLDPTPDTPEERAAIEANDRLVATACAASYGDTVRHYSTVNTARDMDAIRAAIGDTQISFLGFSYGTYLGGVYATLFPDRVRAMVLDSGFDPTGETADAQLLTQIEGFERAFDNWATWCRTTPAECAFSSADVRAAWDALVEKLDTTPVRGTDGRFANNGILVTATIAALYSRSSWAPLATALDRVRAGDATALFGLADAYNGRNTDGTYASRSQASAIINCASGLSTPPSQDLATLRTRVESVAPRFSRLFRLEDLLPKCDPSTTSATLAAVAHTGRAPIVVIGGTNDPATPLRWSEKLTAALGPNTRLVTFTGEGHGFVTESSCVAQAATAVLTTLQLPATGARCAPDEAAGRPDWWGTVATPPGVSEPLAVAGTALGFGPGFFVEVRTTDLGAAAAGDAYDALLRAAGFTVVPQPAPAGITRVTAYRNGSRVLVLFAVRRDDLAKAPPELGPLTAVVGSAATTLLLVVPG